MPDLDLSALRKVAEAANRGIHVTHDEAVLFDYKFNPAMVLALLDELRNARITIEEDKRHFAKFWDDGYQAGHECVGADSKCRRMQNPHLEP